MTSRELLQQVADEVARAYPDIAERARDGSISAEGYLVAQASIQADVDPGEVRPYVQEVVGQAPSSPGGHAGDGGERL